MKFTYLVSALAVFSTTSAVSQPEAAPNPVELEERATTTSLASISNNPLGFATKTKTPATYGFFTKPIFPTLLPPRPPPRNATNETSTSEDAKRFPFLPNSPQHRGNWFPGFNINTDVTNKWPTTFRTVRLDWRISNVTLSPDGTPQQLLVVNGQYPGPLLEANWGDWIEVTVHNDLKSNGTGIHWHGFRQLNTNTEDGVPGITECPIAPGQAKTYRFQATQYGTTWYHTHFSSQYGAGVLGPVIIHGPASANYDIDLGTVMVNDWYAPLTVFQADWFAQRFGPPTASNYLINGKNVKPDGSAGTRASFQFQPGKKHLMRFINNGVDNHFKMQLDGHTFTVIATDFVPIIPYQTKELSIAIGQRYDVVVTADQPTANYYLRALVAPACGRNLNAGTGTANAVVTYRGAPSGLPVTNGTAAIINPQCVDEPLGSLTPIVTIPVDSTGFAAQFDTLPVELRQATLVTGENVFLWYLNGHSQSIDWSLPTIETVADNRTISTASNSSAFFPDDYNIISLPTPDKWTFWVIQNQFFVPHPMHLHGHDFALLGQGTGTFDPAVHLSQLNFANPNRRDVANLVASGWTVIAFKTDNPGSWLMHCHIAWHVGEGLSLQFLELPGQIPRAYGNKINGREFQGECRAWDQYFGGPNDVYGKTDSGLKRREAEVEAEAEPEPAGEAYRGMFAHLSAHLKQRHS